MQSEPAFDLAAALEQIDGDRELFVALADLFMSQAAADMGSIRDALKLGDSQEVMKRAHRLKGSALQFHATGLHEASQRLEAVARRGVMIEAASLAVTVEDRLACLMQALQQELKST
ncbi:MAG TPA: Hpt domain-containing protein [Nitrospiraceae bacterium]|nr:Hpt domain-containing protein [Nitrospiraceae bacterium]